ncbi:hypothetical protein NDU88_004206 [Pleurodeles waltl]|uniref:Uncharacterized protein n=1 Tax=Pleurodeles waltl TaxID=8319 RepID=A0AAV7QHS1_PLEWA|nr:hypothetical protein NDU88_004206 [Pleurodeles waltl]
MDQSPRPCQRDTVFLFPWKLQKGCSCQCPKQVPHREGSWGGLRGGSAWALGTGEGWNRRGSGSDRQTWVNSTETGPGSGRKEQELSTVLETGSNAVPDETEAGATTENARKQGGYTAPPALKRACHSRWHLWPGDAIRTQRQRSTVQGSREARGKTKDKAPASEIVKRLSAVNEQKCLPKEVGICKY